MGNGYTENTRYKLKLLQHSREMSRAKTKDLFMTKLFKLLIYSLCISHKSCVCPKYYFTTYSLEQA